ncbi:MAG: hypothetical protein HYX73_01745 [Acidobacteria bacterium]|nr:hypothetical protein [Acidobacteriota bacterium]
MKRIREVIETTFPVHLPEFELALNTGLRQSEMYRRTSEDVNLAQNILPIPRRQHGES